MVSSSSKMTPYDVDQTLRFPGGSLTVSGYNEAGYILDEPDVQPGLEEEGEEPAELTGPDGEFAPLD